MCIYMLDYSLLPHTQTKGSGNKVYTTNRRLEENEM